MSEQELKLKDKADNALLGSLYRKTKKHFEENRRLGTKCILCGFLHNKSNFPSCKACKKPNLLIKYGFVSSGRQRRPYPSSVKR